MIGIATQKLYSESEIKAMDDAADSSILTMTIVGVGIGFAPVMLDITMFMAEAGIGVVAIGKCYKMKLNKADAGDLIKQFFKAAGLAYSMVFTCEKLGSSALKSNPVSYIPAMIVDAVMCGSISFAIGSTSKRYFKKLAEGKKITDSDIKAWMKEGKKTGKKVAEKYAKEKAASIKNKGI